MDLDKKVSTPPIPSDDNNNTPNNITPPKRARKQFMRERELAEFTKLYYGNCSPEQICSMLRISRSTYYRLVRSLGKQQETLMTEYGKDELFARIAKTQNTLNFVSAEMIKRIINKERHWSEDTELAAANLLCEIQAAELRLYTKGPIKTEKELPLSVKRQLVTTEEGKEVEQIEIEIDNSNNDSSSNNENEDVDEEDAQQQQEEGSANTFE